MVVSSNSESDEPPNPSRTPTRAALPQAQGRERSRAALVSKRTRPSHDRIRAAGISKRTHPSRYRKGTVKVRAATVRARLQPCRPCHRKQGLQPLRAELLFRSSAKARIFVSASSPVEPPLLLNRQRAVRGDWDKVRKFLLQLHSRLEQSGFSVCLVSDRAIRRYNQQYRQRDEPTDVLSFPAGSPEANGRAYLGDILISAETAQRNARRYGLRLEQEIEILVLHGLLHLKGYDHETDGGRMARSEKHWREQFGLPTSLTERARELS